MRKHRAAESSLNAETKWLLYSEVCGCRKTYMKGGTKTSLIGDAINTSQPAPVNHPEREGELKVGRVEADHQ